MVPAPVAPAPSNQVQGMQGSTKQVPPNMAQMPSIYMNPQQMQRLQQRQQQQRQQQQQQQQQQQHQQQLLLQHHLLMLQHQHMLLQQHRLQSEQLEVGDWTCYGHPENLDAQDWDNLDQTSEAQGRDDLLDSGTVKEWLDSEPRQVLVINEASSGTRALLRRDVAEADVVAFDVEWLPDQCGSDNPISVLQLAFPMSQRVYVIQIGRCEKLPNEVQMMLVNPRVTKVGFAVDYADVAKLRRSGIAVTRDSVVDVQRSCIKLLPKRCDSLGKKLGLKG